MAKTAVAKAPAKVAATPKTITYFCDVVCSVDVQAKSIGKAGQQVILIAVGTNATIQFRNNKSPFGTAASDKTIHLTANQAVTKTVSGGSGTYRYGLSCTNCANVVNDPSMIVDP